MQDYTGDLHADYRKVSKRIRDLQSRLYASRDSLSKKGIVDELTQLEQERVKIDNVFLESGTDRTDAGEEGNLPILVSLQRRYRDVLVQNAGQAREVLSLLLYLRYFEDEFIGLFSERKLKLDVKYSVERDGYYHRFNQLLRRVHDYCGEAVRIQEGTYSKKYEQDMLRRMVEMRHAVMIESDAFFRRVHRFAGELIDDLDGDGILCQNGDAELNYSEFDRETELRGITVRDALQLLFDICDEILEYLDIPDFQR